MDLQTNPINEILCASFNQDHTCFVCGTENGFRLYQTDPFKLTHRRDFGTGGSLGVVAMLYRSNIVAFVGGGSHPRYHPHKVIFWDDRKAIIFAELNFSSVVKAVRLRGRPMLDMVVVVTEHEVFVHSGKLLRLDSIKTTPNPKGLCCLSVGSERVVLVCPGMQQGSVVVVIYPKPSAEQKAPFVPQRTTIIPAHDSQLAAISTNYSGTMLATASDKGTVVRVYDAINGILLQELRRGADRAEIHSLAFSPSGEWLAVSSDKGTIHVFSIPGGSPSGISGGGSARSLNSKSSLQGISRMLPVRQLRDYFSSEWSFAQFRVPDHRCIAAFGSDPNSIVIVCANGSYYKARFDPNRGGDMAREDYAQFDDASVRWRQQAADDPQEPEAPKGDDAPPASDPDPDLSPARDA